MADFRSSHQASIPNASNMLATIGSASAAMRANGKDFGAALVVFVSIQITI